LDQTTTMGLAPVPPPRHNRLGDGCGMVGAETRLVQDFPHKPGEFFCRNRNGVAHSVIPCRFLRQCG